MDSICPLFRVNVFIRDVCFVHSFVYLFFWE